MTTVSASAAAQRKIGVASSASVVMASLVLSAFLDVDTFTGVVSFFFTSCTPVLVVLAVHWVHDLPPVLAQRSRTVRGGALLAITLAVGAVAAVFSEAIVGGGNGAHFPPLVMFAIVTVVTSLWLAIVCGGWLFVLLQNKLAALASLLIACYVIAYLLFRTLFDFSFLKGTPVYVAPLDPAGAFGAWNAVTFLITAITGLFLVRSFDFWLFGRTGRAARGLLWTVVCLGWAVVLFYPGVELFDIDVVTFLVRVPIPLVFGGLIVLDVLGGSLYDGVRQPFRGVLNMVTIMAVGSALVMVYQMASRLIGGVLPSGPPTYPLEIWLASATLGISFPALIIQAKLFDYWPFAGRCRPQGEDSRAPRGAGAP